MDGQIIMQYEGREIKMPKHLYELLSHYNTDLMKKKDYYDAKFVLIIVSSFVKADEIRGGTEIQQNDYRLNFARGMYFELNGSK